MKRSIPRLAASLFVWWVACDQMGAPMWAGWLGALIYGYLAFPVERD